VKHPQLSYLGSRVQSSSEVPVVELAASNWQLEKDIESFCSDSKGATTFTFIRHPPLFDDIAQESPDVKDKKTLSLPKGSEYWVAREDIVEAIVAVAFKPKRSRNKALNLLGPERLRAKKVVSILSEVLHEEIKYEPVSRSDTEKLQNLLVKSLGFSHEEAKRAAEYIKASKLRSGTSDAAREEQSAAETSRDSAVASLWSSNKRLQTLREWSDAHAHLFL
jgi:hypothetical protein